MYFLCLVVSLVIKPQNCKVKAEKRPTESQHTYRQRSPQEDTAINLQIRVWKHDDPKQEDQQADHDLHRLWVQPYAAHRCFTANTVYYYCDSEQLQSLTPRASGRPWLNLVFCGVFCGSVAGITWVTTKTLPTVPAADVDADMFELEGQKLLWAAALYLSSQLMIESGLLPASSSILLHENTACVFTRRRKFSPEKLS